MAFTKKFLSSLGIEPDKAEQIFEAHTAVTDILKAEADSAAELKKMLAEANQKLADAQAEDYKSEYESVRAEYEKLKGQLEAEKITASKLSAYREVLKKAGIPEKRIPAVLRVTDIDTVGFDDSFNIRNEDEVIRNIKLEFGGLIPVTEITGTDPETPPAGRENKNPRTGIAAQIQKQYQESMYGVQPTEARISDARSKI